MKKPSPRKRSTKEDQGREYLAEQLEPRVLYSGTVAPDAAAVDDQPAQEAAALPDDQPEAVGADGAPVSAIQAAQEASADMQQFVSEGLEIAAFGGGESDISEDQGVLILNPEKLQQLGGGISQEVADAVLDAAEERWSISGVLTDEQEASLGQFSVEVADLEGDLLLSVSEGNSTILLDIDAAGRNWFVDGTPLDDTEFGERVSLNGFRAESGAAVAGIDVLTVLMESQAQFLGVDEGAGVRDVSVTGLQEGLRRIPIVDESLTNPDAVTTSLVADLANAAAQRWEGSGLSGAQIEALEDIEYRVVDLENGIIGAAENGVISIDIDAAGKGWFVDLSPEEDSEFDAAVSATSLRATGGSAAEGVDLLSVILHEQGHILGLEHMEGSSTVTIMTDVFSEGDRRLIEDGEAEGATPGSLEGVHNATTPTVIFSESFESPVVAGLENATDPSGWTDLSTNVSRTGLGNMAGFSNVTGTQAAFLRIYNSTPKLETTTAILNGTLTANTRYELRFNAATTSNKAYTAYAELYAGTTLVMTASVNPGNSKDFAQGAAEAIHIVNPLDDGIGEPLKIVLRETHTGNPWNQPLYIDNLTLSTVDTTLDNTPPTPNPMTWVNAPTASGNNSILMTASTATDESFVEYYFENTTNGNNSGWIESTTWRDTGLIDGETYDYQVKARDKSANNNETDPSPVASATADSTVLFWDSFESPVVASATSGAADPEGWVDLSTGSLNSSRAGLGNPDGSYSNETGDQAVWLNVYNAEPILETTTAILDETLAANTNYTLSFNAASSGSSYVAYADLYAGDTLVTTAQVSMTNGADKDFADNVAESIHLVSAGDAGVGEALKIRLRVTGGAWNQQSYIDNVKLVAESTASDSTPPTPNPMTWVNAPTASGNNSILMTASTASDESFVEYYFENTTNGNNSGWIETTTWRDAGLTDGVTYDYQVKARDKSANFNETDWSPTQSATADSTVLFWDSFESPVVASATSGATDPEGWVDLSTGSLNSSRAGLGNPDSSYSNETGDQAVWLNVYNSAPVLETTTANLDETLAANTRYELRFNAASSGNNYVVYADLMAGSTVVTTAQVSMSNGADKNFADNGAESIHIVNPGDAGVGDPLKIRLRVTGGAWNQQSYVDNLQLVGVPLVPPDPTTIMLDGDDNIVITDKDGIDNEYELSVNPDGSFTLRDNSGETINTGGLGTGDGTSEVTFAASAFTNGFVINGSDGNDSLTIDFTGNAPNAGLGRTVTYHGNDPTTGLGDSLILKGGTFDKVTENLTGVGAGTIDLGSNGVADITYTGLEPVDETALVVADRIINLPANISDAIFEDYLAATDGFSRIRSASAAFEEIRFQNPTNSLTINASGGSSQITLAAIDAGFTADLTISAGTINLNAVSIETGTGDQTYNGAVVLGSSIELSAKDVFLNGTTALGANDLTVDVTGTTGSSAGGISGTGQVIKTGSGTFTLDNTGAGNNAYTGLTHAQEGVVQLGNGFGGDGGIQGDITVDSGATFRLLGGNKIINSSLITVNGTFDRNGQSDAVGGFNGSGAIVGGGSLTLDLVNGTTTTFSGSITGGNFGVRGSNDNGSGAKQVLTGTSTGIGTLFVERGDSANDASVLEIAGAGSTSATSVRIGQTGGGQGTATLNIGGTHVLNQTDSGNFFMLGEQTGQGGTINQTGGTVNASGDIRIAHWGSENSTWNISAGTLNSNRNMFVSWDGNGNLNASGTADVNANNVTISRGQAVTISDDATFDATTINVGGNNRGQGFLNIQDNAIVKATDLSVGDFNGPGEDGTVNQDGGSFTVSNLFRIGHYGSETSNYNMNGGTLSLTGTPSGGTEQAGILYLGIDGTGNFTQTGGSVSAAGMRLDNRSDNAGIDTFTLNGGTMTLGSAGITANPSTQISLGGGTLAASADWASSVPMNITGTGGDTKIDTNGFNIGLSGNIAGGNLDKIDDGTLTLSGATNTFGTLDAAGGNLILAGSSTTTVSGQTRVGVSPGSNGGLADSGSGVLTVQDSATLTSTLIYMGENNTPIVGGLTGTINQTGGTVRTTGVDGEGNGIRIGHWGNETSTYNLSGGNFVVDNGAELAIAITGVGVFNQTGGTATAETVVVNARGGGAGNGTFTVEGGTFNVGSGGIVNEGTGPDAVNLGGGTAARIVSTADWNSSLAVNLTGTGATAVTIDTAGFDVGLSGVTEGTGGFSKEGTGTLTLSGTPTNTYAGATNVNGGTLLVNGDSSGANGPVSVASGAILGGTGTVGGIVVADSGSDVQPGVSGVGTLTIDANITINGDLDIDISGANADQLNVDGDATAGDDVNLTGTLTITGTGPTAALYTIIDNDGTTDAVQGVFSNLNVDGATIDIDGVPYKIFYGGGDGNDVVLADATTPTVVYVDDLWATGINGGQPIDDADLGTVNDQNAIFKINAFATIGEALATVGTGGTIIVNGGTYNEAVTLADGKTIEITGPDADQVVAIDSLATTTGTTVDIEGTSSLTIGDGTDTTIAGSIAGTGTFTKVGSGNVTLTEGPSASLTGFASPNPDTTILSGLTVEQVGRVEGALLGGAWVNSGTPVSAEVRDFTNDGTTATFVVVAVEGGHVKANKVQLTNSGGGVAVQVLSAKVWLNTAAIPANFDYDVGGAAGTVSTSAGAGGYGTTGLTLITGNNANYTGDVTVTDGTLSTRYTEALGSGTLIMNGGTLNTNVDLANDITLNNTANTFAALGNYRVLSGQISGVGGFTLADGGAGTAGLALSNSGNDFDGNITINSGTFLRLDASEVIPDTATVNANGSLRFQGDNRTETIAGLNGAGRVFAVNSGGGATLRVGAGDVSSTHTGQIGGGGANNKNFDLVKIGNGTFTLGSGASDFTGNVSVEAGILKLSNENALGATNTAVTKVTVADGATVDFNGIRNADYGYTISGDGVGGNGALINTGVGINNSTKQSANVALASDASIGGTGNWALLASAYAPTTLDLAGFELTKVGTNTVTLANATVTAGAITISEGVITQISNNKPNGHDLSAVAVTLGNTAGAILALNDLDLTVGSLAGGGTSGGDVTLGSGDLTIGDLDLSTTFAGDITGSGDVTKIGSGTLTLNGNLDHAGSTSINGGTAQLNQSGVPFPGAGSTGQFGSSHTVTVNNGATLEVTQNWVIGDGIQNKVVVDEGGTLAFVNSDNYAGNIELTGAAITTSGGNRPWRVGNYGPGAITVNASTIPSTITGSLAFVGNGNGPTTTFDVADGAQLNVSAVIYDHPGFGGAMDLIKTGLGTMELSGDNSYGGVTTIAAGALALAGSGDIDQSGEIAVTSGATFDVSGRTGGGYAYAGDLTGQGTVVGDLTVGVGGNLQPGDNSGANEATLTIDGDFAISGDFDFSIDGSNSDLIDANNGTVTVGGTLTFDVTTDPTEFIITVIDNDAADQVQGTFTGLVDGATVPVGTKVYKIFYNGGDGNDVVLVDTDVDTVYVDDNWATGLNPGQNIADGDIGTNLDQPAVFQANAFATIAEALAAVNTGGTIIVNGGTYTESVSLADGKTIEITGPDVAQVVTIDSLATATGTTVDIEGSSSLTIGDGSDTTLAGSIVGTGSLTKVGGGNVTITEGPSAALAGYASPNANTTILNGVTVSEIGRVEDALMSGGWIPNGTVAEVFNFANDGTTVTFQIAAIDGPYTKANKIQITDFGGGVAVQVLEAGYWNGNVLNASFDFDTTPNRLFAPVSTGGNGYGTTGLTLITGNNANFSGGVTITEGTLSARYSEALGSGDLTMNGGTLNTNVDLANDITLNSTANTFAPNGFYRELSGEISGPGGFTVANGGGTPGLALSNTANDFEGDVTINAGTFLRLIDSEVIPDTASVINNGNLRLDVPGGGTETISGLSGTGTVWIPTSNSNDHNLVVGANDATSTFDGTIGAANQNNTFLALTKIGDGTFTLTSDNLYSGGTTVDDGVLNLANTANNGVGTIRGTVDVNADGILRLSGPNSLGWQNAGVKVNTININGGLVDNVANGDNGWNLTVNMTGGELRSNGGTSSTTTGQLYSLGGGTSVINVLSGTSTVSGRINIRQAALPIDVAAGATLNFTAGVTQQGVAAGLTKTGDGTMNLSATAGIVNSATGLLLVSEGQVNAGGGFAGDGAWSGDVTIDNGATLRMDQSNIFNNGSDFTVDGTLDMNGLTDVIGNIQGAGDIINNTNAGTGIILDDLNSTHVFTGDISGGGALLIRSNIADTGTQVLSGGTIALGNFRIGDGAVTITDNAAVTTTGVTTVATNRSDLPGITLQNVEATLNIESGSLNTVGILAGNVAGGTVTGTINQSGGTVTTTGSAGEGNGIRLGHWPNSDVTYNLSGGTLTVGGGQSLSTATDGTGKFTQTGGTANATGVDVNSRGGAGGNGTFEVLGGTFNLGAGGINQDSSANATVNLGGQGGTIVGTANSTSAVAATLFGTGTTALTINTGGFEMTSSGVLSGGGDLNKIGAGALLLNADNTFTGATLVTQGLLGGTGSVDGVLTVTGATLDPGLTTGDVTDDFGTGTLTFDNTATFHVDLDGTTVGSGFDQIDVTGGVTLADAKLTLDLNFAPEAGNIFTIIDNDLTDVVSGLFTDAGGDQYTHGEVFELNDGTNNYAFSILYNVEGSGVDRTDPTTWDPSGANAGNDVVLLAYGAVETEVSTDAAGNLIITDINGGVSDDAITIVDDGTNYIITDPNLALTTTASGGRLPISGAVRVDGNTISVAKADVTGLIVNTLGDTTGDTVTFGGTNPIDFDGDIVINAETENTVLSQNVTSTTGNITFNGPVTVSTSVEVESTTGDVDFASTVAITNSGDILTVDVAGTGSEINGIVSGAGAITKEGTGTITMTASANSMTGGITINDGSLRAYGGNWTNAFFTTTGVPITINDGGTLETTTHSLGGLGTTLRSPNIIVNEGGTWQLNNEQYLDANQLDLNGGTVNIVNNDLRLLGGTVAVGSSGTGTGSEIIGNAVTLFGTVTFDVDDEVSADPDLVVTARITQNGNRTLVKQGAGTMAIQGGTTTAANTIFNVLSNGGILSFEETSVTNITNNLAVGDTVTGTVNIADTADVNITNELLVGDSNGVSGIVNQTGGSVDVDNRIRLAHWPNNVSEYNISAGTLDVTNALNVGWDGTGVFTQTGGTVDVGQVYIDGNGLTGPNGTQDDELNISAGQFTAGFFASGGGFANISGTADVDVNGSLHLGEGAGRPGAVNQTGGTVDVSGEIRVGNSANETSTYDLSAGTLNSNGLLYVGFDGIGDMNVSDTGDLNAGTVIVQRNSDLSIADNATVDTGFVSIGDQRGTGTVTQTGGTVTAAGEIRIGHWAAGANSQYNISGGLLDANGALSVGWDGTNAAMNVSGAADVDAGFIRVQRDANLNISGGTLDGTFLNIGEAPRGAGTVTLTGGTTTINGEIRVASSATGTLNVSGGLLDANGTLSVGYDGANGDMNISGTGDVDAGTVIVQRNADLSIADTSTFDATFLSIGDQRGTGTVTQTGGTSTVNGDIRIAHWGAGTDSEYNISAGTLNNTAGNLYVGWDGSNAELNVTGTGDVNVTNTVVVQRDGDLNIADNATLDAANLSAGDQRGNGVITQDGGAVTFTNVVRIGHWGAGNDSIYNMNGGTLDLTGTPAGGTEQAGGIYLGVDGTGTLNHTDGTVTTNFLWLDNRGNTAGTDEYNMTGGTLVLTNAIGIGSSNEGSIAVNLGGGTIQADVDTQITTPATLTGTNGNVTFDTNGNTLTANDVLSGTGGLIKTGANTLVVSGTNSYIGTTAITEGILLVSGTHTGGDDYTVSPGATLSGTGTVNLATGKTVLASGTAIVAPGDPGVNGGIGTLTIGSDDTDSTTAPNTVTLGGEFDFQINGDISADLLDVNGTVTLGGNLDLEEITAGTDSVTYGSTITLIDNDGTTDAVSGTFAGLPEGSEVIDDDGDQYVISYVGNDGNDVVLFAGEAEAEVSFDSSGNLVITDINDDSAENLSIEETTFNGQLGVLITNPNAVLTSLGTNGRISPTVLFRPTAQSVFIAYSDPAFTGGIVVNTANETNGTDTSDDSVTIGDLDLAASSKGGLVVNADSIRVTGDVKSGGEVTLDATPIDGAIVMENGATIDAGSFDIDLDADNDITLGGLETTGLVTIDSANGNIVDGGDSDVDVTASDLAINAPNGSVGDGDALDTQVANLEGSSDGVFSVDNTGDLSISTNGITSGGNADVSTTGSLTVGDGITVQSTGGEIDLDAGNDFTLHPNGSLLANGQITIDVDQIGTTDTVGATVDLRGTVTAETGSEVFVTGGLGIDTFNITPSATTVINVAGSEPDPDCDGDLINLYESTADTLFPGTIFNQATSHVVGSGVYSFPGVPGAMNVVVTGIEDDNVDPRLIGMDITDVNEGDEATLSGQIIDLGGLGVHELRIDWGDGTALETVNLGAPGPNATINDDGTFTVTHLYVDDNPTGTPSDKYDVSVTVEDNCDDRTAMDNTLDVIVTNVDPTVGITTITDQVGGPVDENDTAVLTGSFTDPGLADSHKVVIDWDDPNNATNSEFNLIAIRDLTPNQTFNSGDGAILTITSTAADLLNGIVSYSVDGHQFLDDGPAGGNATAVDISNVQVTVTDDDTGSGTADFNLNVFNVAPQLINVLATPNVVNENGTITVTGNIVDPGTLDAFQLTIAWGDGKSDTLTLPAGSTSFSVSHVYDSGGNYSITVTLLDDDLAAATAVLPVRVINVPPSLDLNPIPDVTVGDTSVVNGSFTDPGLVSDHTITVDWGDGTSSVFDLGPTNDLDKGDRFRARDGSILTITGVDLRTGEVEFSIDHKYGKDGIFNVSLSVSDGVFTVTAQLDATVFLIAPTDTTPGIFTNEEGQNNLLGILGIFRNLGDSGLFAGFRVDDTEGIRMLDGIMRDEEPGNFLGDLSLTPFFAGTTRSGATVVITVKDEVGNPVGSQSVIADLAGNWTALFPDLEIEDGDYTVEIQVSNPIWGSIEGTLESQIAMFNGSIWGVAQSISDLGVGQIVGVVVDFKPREEAVELDVPFALDGSDKVPTERGIQLLEEGVGPDANTELRNTLGLPEE